MAEKLTQKQLKFIREYLVDLNATQAAIRAGYSVNSAGTTGAEYLEKPEIRARVNEEMEKRAQRTEITADRVLQELARIAFNDISELTTWSESRTRLMDSSTLTKDQTASVAEVYSNAAGETRIKMYDKIRALETLGKHLKLFNDKIEIGDIVIRVNLEGPEPEAEEPDDR